MKKNVLLFQLLLCFIIGITVLFRCSLFARDWYEEYNIKWQNGIEPSSTLPWSETYILRSYISMYRASKVRGESIEEQQKWIDRLIEHCDYVVNSPDMEEEGKSYLVWAGHGFTPLAGFIKIIFSDEALYSKYKVQANNYLYYIESKIVPHWRNQPADSQWQFTPFNWYLSYGSLLMNLHQITRLPYYSTPYYSTPDTALNEYYYNTVTDMAKNYFQDFGKWEYGNTNWQWDFTCYPKIGLCYCPPPLDAYIWRYYDYGDYLAVSGNNQLIETRKSVNSNEWYRIVIDYKNDALEIKWYDSTGINLIYNKSMPWIPSSSNSDLYIGRRLDAQSSAYLHGIIDELKITKNGKVVGQWSFEGNADDISGNGHNGTINGNPEWVQGKFGQAFKFDYDYIVIPHHPDLDDFSQIELWLKFSECTPKYYNYILGKGLGFPDSLGYYLYVYSYKRPEDVGHANLDIEFLVKTAHDPLFSSFYPNNIIERFCNTFTKIVVSNSDITHPEFRSHLHPDSSYGDLNASTHTFRWLWLYEFEPVIGELINNWYENNPSAQSLSEAIANLACWQAGLYIDEDETVSVENERSLSYGGQYNIRIEPNPFINSTYFHYQLAFPGKVMLKVYDVLGNEKRTLLDEFNEAGSHSIVLKAENLPQGMYYYTFRIGDFIKCGKLILVK